MSFSPPWRSACALRNAPSPALRVKTPRRGAQCGPRGSAESGFLARRGWGAVGAAASSFCRALDGRTPRPVPETGAHTRLADTRVWHCPSAPGSAASLSVPSLASCFLPSEPSLRYDDPEDRGQQRGEGGPWGRLPSRSRAAPLQQALSAEQLPFPPLVAQAFADAPSARDDRHSQEILANGRPAGSGPWSSPCSAGKREPSGLLEQGAASGAQPGGGLAGLVQLVPWLSQNA